MDIRVVQYYRVSQKYQDFSGIGIDTSIEFSVSKIDTENALGKMAMWLPVSIKKMD